MAFTKIDAPSKDLVERAAGGNPAAQSELVEPWLTPVVHWAARLSGPHVDPEDIAHEVFIVVLTKLGNLRSADDFPSWLYGITRRIIAKHRRRVWLKRWVGAPTQDPMDPNAGPAADFDTMQSTERVKEILEKIPNNQREVLVLMVVEERSAPEVARLLGLAEGTVRSRLRLARARFAKLAIARGLDPTPPTTGRFEEARHG